METKCGKGWTERCASAKGAKCTCSCGGENHGKKSGIKPAVREDDGVRLGAYSSASVGEVRLFAEDRSMFINGDKVSPDLSQSYRNHSPDGFNWGYGGSGPAQTALALLLEFTDSDFAQKNYQAFKFDAIATLEQNKDATIPVSSITKWVDEHGY